MSVQHQNRQAKLIRQQITQQYNEQHAIRLSGRNLEKEIISAEHKNTRLETELSAALALISELQAQLATSETGRIEADAEAAKQQKRADQHHDYMMQTFHALQDSRAAHNKLSKIMRLAISPERYLQYRDIVEG